MRSLHIFLFAVGLLTANAVELPPLHPIAPDPITSPSILHSLGFEVDVAVDAHTKAAASISQIVIDANVHKEDVSTTAEKIRQQVALLNVALAKTTWAVEGDINDAVHRIGSNEARLLKIATDKLVALARKMQTEEQLVGAWLHQGMLNDRVPALLEGEGKALATSMRSIIAFIENFVNASIEDVADPGSLRVAKEETARAAKDIDALFKEPSSL